MRRNTILAFILGASLALTGSAFADPDAFSPWIGTYRSAAPDQAKSTIDRAIEEGTSDMGPLRRSVARNRLRSTNQMNDTVRITPAEEDELVIDFDGRKYRAPTSGAPEKGRDPDGKTVTVSYKAAGNTLKSRYVAEDGEKQIDFERSPGGESMIMHVTVLSKKLPGPIKYSIRYNKKS